MDAAWRKPEQGRQAHQSQRTGRGPLPRLSADNKGAPVYLGSTAADNEFRLYAISLDRKKTDGLRALRSWRTTLQDAADAAKKRASHLAVAKPGPEGRGQKDDLGRAQGRRRRNEWRRTEKDGEEDRRPQSRAEEAQAFTPSILHLFHLFISFIYLFVLGGRCCRRHERRYSLSLTSDKGTVHLLVCLRTSGHPGEDRLQRRRRAYLGKPAGSEAERCHRGRSPSTSRRSSVEVNPGRRTDRRSSSTTGSGIDYKVSQTYGSRGQDAWTDSG